MERTISFMNGEGSIGHNTRRFKADNVDASRTKNNITLIHDDIKQAYHKLFHKALKEYNAKQKCKDRQIKSYYDKISRSKQEKLFYEIIVQIGNKDNTRVGSYSAEVATWVLKDYVKKFQLRNSQLYVIGAYIHLDVKYSIVLIVYGVYRVKEKRKIGTTYTNRKKNVYDVIWKRTRKILKAGRDSGSFFML